MILTCPDCATRYSTTSEAIGPNGRTVRCSSCSATWFVSAEPDIMELHEQERDQQIIRETPPDELLRDSEPAGFGTKPVTGAHVQIRDQADQRRRNQRLMGISMVWVITLGALVFAAALAYRLRQPIVEKFPAAASIYQAFNINVKSLGLDFEDPKTRRVIIEGTPTLVVNGYVRNRTNEVRDVPMIELSLRTQAGETLAVWAVEPPQATLDAGKRMEYVSEYPNPPIEASVLKYRFLEEGELIASEVSDEAPLDAADEPADE